MNHSTGCSSTTGSVFFLFIIVKPKIIKNVYSSFGQQGEVHNCLLSVNVSLFQQAEFIYTLLFNRSFISVRGGSCSFTYVSYIYICQLTLLLILTYASDHFATPVTAVSGYANRPVLF